MANRRMLTKKVTDDDNFMALSSSAQALYLHLSMSADDDGFSNQVSISMFKAHASVQDLQALLEKRYIYQFENGVIVIKHWRMANALRKDRYTPTAFQEELAQLGVKENGAYTWLPNGCQEVAERLPQVRLGKDSIDKDSKGYIETTNVVSCTEPETASVPPIPLSNGSEWQPSVSDFEEWTKVYPGVDITNEFNRMRQWCLSNPTKRKTARGVRRFVTGWLDRQQNKSGTVGKSSYGSGSRFADKIDAVGNWGKQFEKQDYS